MLSSRFSRVLSSISAKTLTSRTDEGRNVKSKASVYAEGEPQPQDSGSRLGLSRRGGMFLRTLCAWAVYQGVVFILYLPYKDDWYTNEKTSGFVDALYFGSVTLSTVGYGDILPGRDEQMLLTAFLILFALSFVVYLLGELSTLLLSELAEANAKKLAQMANADTDGDGILDKNETFCSSIIYSPRTSKFVTGVSIITMNLALGIAMMMVWEDLDFAEALYFSMVTITTVGYGDYAPTRQGTRLFAAVWLLVAPVLTSYGLTSIVEAVFNTDGQVEKLRTSILKGATSVQSLQTVDKDGDGKYSKEEFAGYVVKQLVAAEIAKEEANDFLAELIENLKKADKSLLD